MDELTAYVLIENNPFEISLNVKPTKPFLIVKEIEQEIKAELENGVDFQLVFAKYKYLNFRNIELYCFFKSRFFREELITQQKDLLTALGYKDLLSVQMEIHEEITGEFDNILKKYNFEKG